jgi:hypothetical protein
VSNTPIASTIHQAKALVPFTERGFSGVVPHASLSRRRHRYIIEKQPATTR